MNHVADADTFRRTRLGTLRSHPSVRFPETSYFPTEGGDAVALAEELERWMTAEEDVQGTE